jgi:hypothetical protein
MKPRPGVPFSWYFKGDFYSKDYGKASSLALRKTRVSRAFHKLWYYEDANITWAKAGEWSNVATREYFGRHYGLAFFRNQSLLIKHSWRIE